MQLRQGIMLQVKDNRSLMLFKHKNNLPVGLSAKDRLEQRDIILVLYKATQGWWHICALGSQYLVRGNLLHANTHEP